MKFKLIHLEVPLLEKSKKTNLKKKQSCKIHLDKRVLSCKVIITQSNYS